MSWIFIIMFSFILNGCSILPFFHNKIVDRGQYKIDTSFSSIAQNSRNRFLIIHYTALDDKRSLDMLLNGGHVSAHYLIPSMPLKHHGKPVILQLVKENQRAWHAGVSDWCHRNNINDTSIGIEIVNPGYTHNNHGFHWYPFHPSQIDLIIKVCRDIIQRYDIKPINVLAHSDIAPLRKYDPGPLFPWKTMFDAGIGAWPDLHVVNKYLAKRHPNTIVPVLNIQNLLTKYGYSIPQHGQLDKSTRKVISAFQMHFRAENISGQPDAETEAIILALIEKYK